MNTQTNNTPIDGASLLSTVQAFIRRFCAFPDEHCLAAVTLWAAHTHMVEHFNTTPRLALLSPEAASGKTRVLEVLDLLVSEGQLSLYVSPATIFRTLAQRQITLLHDESDAIWRKHGKNDDHEDLRALLNAGYKRGATIPRCVGPQHTVVNFRVYCAVALAGLGELPDTIMSRSIIIRMRRRTSHERVESFRVRLHEKPGHELRDLLAQWAAQFGENAGRAWPDLPNGIVDRPAEIWEPLIAIADVAGGDWPAIARTACIALCQVAEDRRMSLGVRLLSDLRIIFEDARALHTETIVTQLRNGDQLDADAPWGNLHGRSLSKRDLASMLKQYQVKPQKVTINGISLQGYRRESLMDAWARYLPSLDTAEPEFPELPESADDGDDHGGSEIPAIPEIPDTRVSKGATANAHRT